MEKDNNIMHGKGEKGEWKTINGAHVFVEDGQSVEDAMNKTFSKGKSYKEYGFNKSEKQPSKSHQLSDSDRQIVDDAIYWAKKDGKGNVKGAMEQLEADMSGFLSYGENGNYEAVRDYMREQLGDESSDSVKKSINQDKDREDRYISSGNADNISKSCSVSEVSEALKSYKGSGTVDLVMPGGKWLQIRPQTDDTLLIRGPKGKLYVASADEVRAECSKLI